MFVRNCWKPHSGADTYAFIEGNPWPCSSITVRLSHCGEPAASPRRFRWRQRRPGRSHSARLCSCQSDSIPGCPALALFQGPHSYVTPSWYPKRDMPLRSATPQSIGRKVRARAGRTKEAPDGGGRPFGRRGRYEDGTLARKIREYNQLGKDVNDPD